ncbi:MAG: PAS domain S-box protein [Anaerolineae bacterium]|nr:PAS domain S-box protein [Anaerolineae bacterium]
MHKLLERQLKRHIGSVDSVPEEWKKFIEVVDEVYRQTDIDRTLLERSLDLTSEELFEKNQQLQQQVAVEQKRAAELGQEITERKRAEESLQESEFRLQTIMNSVQAGIVMVDAETREIVEANPAALRMIGADKEKVIGNVCHKFICPAERGRCPICDLGQTVDNSERVLLTAQKKVVPIIKNVITITLGERKYLVESFVDIAQQKRAEETLTKRATELETVAQVSTAALNILDTPELLQTVVDLTKERFGLYHAHIYLLDDITSRLVLAAGAGEVGRQMVSEGWNIPLERGQSLVARVARSRQGVIVGDVRSEPDWLPNPLLPETRSELAVPLLSGDRLLGVLDVQSDKLGYFTDDDIRIQIALAVQVAVALENARLFEQAEQADLLLHERVKELDCLNDIGREMEENPPPLPELLQWISERIPLAMRYPELSVVAIEYDGQVYGDPRAIDLPNQITHGLYIGGELEGRIYIAHTERHDFIDEESALLGGVATRVSGFIENQRLIEQTRQRSAELEKVLVEVRRLAAIVENHPDFIGVSSMEGRALYVNPAGLKMMGLPPDQDITSMVAGDFYPPEDVERLVKEGVPVALEQGSWTTEANLLRADGAVIPVEQTISVNYDIEGVPSSYSVTIHDITNRRVAAAEQSRLLADVRRLAAIVENHPDFIGVGRLDGKVDYINPAGLRMMELSPEHNVSSMEVSDFYLPEDAEKLIDEGLPTALEKGPWTAEANLLRADGTTMPVEQTISINYDVDGKPSNFSITVHDISNRRLAAAEQERLLAEVEASYRQYVRQEWEQYLQEQRYGRWQIEHRQPEAPVESATGWLAKIQDEVLREGKTKIVRKTGDNGDEYLPTGDERQTAAIVTPISLRGQVIGTLNLQDMAPDRNWTAEEIALVEAVSEQLALTVENLRLFDDTQRRATREQLTRQITDKMRVAPDVDTIIQTGLAELARALGVSRTYVKLSPSLKSDQQEP